MAQLTVPAKMSSLEKSVDFVLEGAKGAGFDEKSLSEIKLACEEIIVNVINYAYPDKEGDISIEYALNDRGEFEIVVSDEGVPFNPLSLPQPDIEAPLEERKIGGLGIFLVRKVMDEVTYRRKGNTNILRLVKRIKK